MKETKQQVINRLANDNLALRTQNSVLTTELAFARSKLNEADIRARRLIASSNRVRSTEVSDRKRAMEAAKLNAMSTGRVSKVGGDHA